MIVELNFNRDEVLICDKCKKRIEDLATAYLKIAEHETYNDVPEVWCFDCKEE